MRIRTYSGMALGLFLALAALPVSAQGYRNDNPNLHNFYMARQQVQITDDAPTVNDMRTNPSAGTPGAGIPGAGAALPRAGFGTNMGNYNGGAMKSGLPTVNNGVPPKAPPPKPAYKAKGGSKVSAPRTASAPSVKTYAPYKTYTGVPTGSQPPGGSLLNSSRNVRGSVLHWNKRKY